MEFRVLGSMQVVAEGELIQLAGDKQRRLLARLLIDMDQVVSLQRLVDMVWDDCPPATAKRQIQNAISALRRQVVDASSGTPAIVVEGGGYRISASAGQLDARIFQQRDVAARDLVAAGLPQRARAEWRAALGLWRGGAFQGLAGKAFEAAAARLDEQRLAATEGCIDLELSLGMHSEVIGELSELAAAHPLRERLVGQLMLALSRSGRQAEALRAYHTLRDRLTDELALDPSSHLRGVYVAILGDTPVAAPSASARQSIRVDARDVAAAALPVPAQLPTPVTGFTGRAKELAELERPVPIFVITGMAGAGKTALAVHWAHRARDRFPDGQIYVNLYGFDPTGPQVSPGGAIRGLLIALAVRPEQIPDDLDAQTGLFRSLLAGRRMLLLLDNARDAAQVRPLLPGSPSCRVLITSRHRLSGLVAGEGANLLALDLLSAVEARDLLAVRVGHEYMAADPVEVDEIINRCAGLPLALAIVAARAAAQRELPLAALADELRDGDGRLDAFGGDDPATDVRAVFSWSYTALSPAARRLFRLLALHPGPDISAAATASLAGRSAGPVRTLLSELVTANLLLVHRPRRYSMHDLLRAYATELVGFVDSDADRRDATHRILDHYLHTGYAAARSQHPQRHPITVSAQHPEVIPECHRNAADAVAWFDAEHSVLLACGLRAVQAGFDAHAWQLAWTMAEFLDQGGHWHESAALQCEALLAAQRSGDLMGQAHIHRALGRVHLRMQRIDDAIGHLTGALALFGTLGEQVAEARTQLDLAWASDQQGRYDRALVEARRALDLFHRAGHLPGQADALNAVGSYHAFLGDYRQALDVCHRALGLHRKLSYQRGQAGTLARLGYAHLHLGEHGEAIDCYQRSIDLFRAFGARYDEAAALSALGDVHVAASDDSAARDNWRQALSILGELDHGDAQQVRAKLERHERTTVS